MVDKLSNEIEELRRDDVQGNLSLLKKGREFLHCNHSLLTELRVQIIPNICRGPGKSTKHFPMKVLLFFLFVIFYFSNG